MLDGRPGTNADTVRYLSRNSETLKTDSSQNDPKRFHREMRLYGEEVGPSVIWTRSEWERNGIFHFKMPDLFVFNNCAILLIKYGYILNERKGF